LSARLAAGHAVVVASSLAAELTAETRTAGQFAIVLVAQWLSCLQLRSGSTREDLLLRFISFPPDFLFSEIFFAIVSGANRLASAGDRGRVASTSQAVLNSTQPPPLRPTRE